MGIFRSLIEHSGSPDEIIKCHETMRPPSNVPYLVDNLWEWKRFMKYPSRRFSVFASPSPSLAIESGQPGGKVYSVHFSGKFIACQLITHQDSKFHLECHSLLKLIIKLVGKAWINSKMSEKERLGRLWMPCLRKKEVENIFDDSEILRGLSKQIYDEIKYWDSIVSLDNPENIPCPTGEIFFQPIGGYFLKPYRGDMF